MGAVDLVIQVESPGRGQPRAAAHRPRRPPGRRAEQGLDLPEAPRRPARGGGRRAAHARRPDRVDPLPAQPARRARPADRRPHRGARRDARRRPRRAGAPVRPTSPSCPTSSSPTRSTCSPGATRARSSPSCGRGSCGTGSTTRCGPATAPSGSPSRRGGTIPDRGLFGVFLPDGTRVGELDEEMVYESRPGETFVLGASTWRIEDITFERVTVTPAPGRAGQDAVLARRPARAGRSSWAGRSARSSASCASCRRPRPPRCCASDYALDELAAANLLQYLDEQAEATGVVPDDRTIVVERFRDEIGDWRICLLSPFGTPVHAPWAMAIERRLTDRYDLPVESMWGDDGIVLRLPEAADELPLDALMIDPEDIEELVVATLPQTALFSSRFRECAGRALLLPRRRPDQRTPLWQQRQQAADLLAVAAKYPTFPILLEASRECLQDVFDVPALREVLGQLRSRAVRVVTRRHGQAEPDGPEPAVQLDRRLHVRGRRPAGRAAGRGAGARPRPAARPARRRGAARAARPRRARRRRARPAAPLRRPPGPQRRRAARRAAPGRRPHRGRDRPALRGAPAGDGVAGRAAGRDAGDRGRRRRRGPVRRRRRRRPLPRRARLRAAARAAGGVHRAGAAPAGGARRPLRPHPRPVRRARGRRPLRRARGAGRRRAGGAGGRRAGSCAASSVPRACAGSGATPTCCASCAGARWPRCAARSSRSSRRRWPGSCRRGTASRAQRRGVDAVVEALGVLAGAPIVASTLETDVLAGAGRRLPPGAARRAVHGRRRACGSAPARSARPTAGCGCASPTSCRCWRPGWEAQDPPGGRAARRDPHRCSRERGASFWSQLRAAAPGAADDELLAALWDLVWAGEVTNDSLAPLRAVTGGPARAAARRGPAGRGRARDPGRLNRIGPPAGAGRWSLVAPLLEPAPTPTEAAHATALQLVERHGVVTREAVLAEGVVGGYAVGVRRAQGARGARPGPPRLLRQRARRGPVRPARRRRPAAPASASAADDAIGSAGVVAAPVVLAATDPGPAVRRHARLAGVAGPPGPHRRGAVVVLRDGVPIAWYDRRSHHLVTFPHTLDDRSWAEALADLVRAGRLRKVEVRKVDGEPLATSPRRRRDHRRRQGRRLHRRLPRPRRSSRADARSPSCSLPACGRDRPTLAERLVHRAATAQSARRDAAEAGPGEVADLAGELVGVEVARPARRGGGWRPRPARRGRGRASGGARRRCRRRSAGRSPAAIPAVTRRTARLNSSSRREPLPYSSMNAAWSSATQRK